MTIVYRNIKGSPLTWAELDGNFTDLVGQIAAIGSPYTLPAGWGIATPDGSFHIHAASAGVVTANANANTLVVENNFGNGISILTPDTTSSLIMFGSPSDNRGAEIGWTYDIALLQIGNRVAGGEISFISGAGGPSRLYIDSSGNVGIGTTTPGTELTISSTVPRLLYVDESVSNTGISTSVDASKYNIESRDDDGTFNATLVTVERTGNVGIGTTTPDGRLHSHQATAGAVTALGGYDQIVAENSTNGGISILTPDASFGGLVFGSPSSNAGAFIQWQNSTGSFEIAANAAGSHIEFQIASVEAMRIDNARNVGIGTTTPDGKLHVHTSSAGAVTAHSDADDLVVENTTLAGISILVGPTGVGSIYFGDPGSSVQARIVYDHSVDDMWFYTAGFERLRIKANGSVGIGTSFPNGVSQLEVTSTTKGFLPPRMTTTQRDAIIAPPAGLQIFNTTTTSTQEYTGAVWRNIGASGTADPLLLGAGAAATPTYSFSADTDTGIYSLGADQLVLSTGGVNALVANASQNIGLGTGSPDGRLHVHTASAGVVTASVNADDFIVENGASGGISILVPDISNSNIYFGSPSNSAGSVIRWNYVGNFLHVGTYNAGAIIEFRTGADVTAMTIASDQGAYMTGAIGGSQGSGTFNAVGVYDDSVLLTCYVPHFIVDGTIDLTQWDGYVPDKENLKTFHEPARRFLDDVSNRIEVEKFTDYWKTNKHLPTMPSKEEWVEDGPKSTGAMIQMLWETVELQASHIDQLLTRIEALEKVA